MNPYTGELRQLVFENNEGVTEERLKKLTDGIFYPVPPEFNAEVEQALAKVEAGETPKIDLNGDSGLARWAKMKRNEKAAKRNDDKKQQRKKKMTNQSRVKNRKK